MELNEKLARWAGFGFRPESSFSKFWIDPIEGKHWTLPDFTSSLDACFKWLVTELDHPNITLYFDVNVKEWYCKLVAAVSPWEIGEFAETPALALCEAIEKFIDGTSK